MFPRFVEGVDREKATEKETDRNRRMEKGGEVPVRLCHGQSQLPKDAMMENDVTFEF
jgi:hypothetical protein